MLIFFKANVCYVMGLLLHLENGHYVSLKPEPRSYSKNIHQIRPLEIGGRVKSSIFYWDIWVLEVMLRLTLFSCFLNAHIPIEKTQTNELRYLLDDTNA